MFYNFFNKHANLILKWSAIIFGSVISIEIIRRFVLAGLVGAVVGCSSTAFLKEPKRIENKQGYTESIPMYMYRYELYMSAKAGQPLPTESKWRDMAIKQYLYEYAKDEQNRWETHDDEQDTFNILD